MKKENILTIINSINSILYIFLGPFLISYFIKISPDNISKLSYFYIISFSLMIIIAIILGKLLERKNCINIFRIGIILNSIYILYIVIMKKKIINNLPILALFYALSCMFYNYPKNLFWSDIIKNENRTKWSLQNKIIGAILSVITPIILGLIITKSNYINAGIFVLLLSIIEIIFSLKLENIKYYDYKFNLRNTLKLVNKNINLKRILCVEYLLGMTIVNGALNVLITILTIFNFKTDINLGNINSIIAFLSIIFIIIYTKYFDKKNDHSIIIMSCIVSLIGVILYVIKSNYVTLIIYNVCYTIFFSFIYMVEEIRFLNNMKKSVNEKNKILFLTLREIFLNLGKIISFVLLLISNGNIKLINTLIIILTSTILLSGYLIIKVDKANY